MKVAPTNPYHIARAYNVAPPQFVRAQTPVEATTAIRRNDDALVAHKQPTNVDRLVAATVPGRIDFTDAGPRHDDRSAAIPLYRHPADLNAAATNVHAGRTLDVSA